ncbi:hypothetical protein [Pantoea dispersa]|uniref:hypothetical protein n=1 Tax=Pantoea dispersa TaxID=59814 RepID=UPI0007371416|nr:hypothetical protein [Pantoea dispersa]KTR99850.1 hypothetical protein NS375_08150 [Pantoea dispersa]
MSESLKDQINQAVKDRLSNPVWGYIFLAWFGFNWESLAILFMSEAPVKLRLDYINSNEHHLFYFFIAPALAGAILSVITPYIQLLLSEAHKWADKKHREAINFRLEKKYEDQESLADKKFRAANAEKLAQARFDADILVEIERGKQATIDTKHLEDNLNNLQDRIKQAEKLNDKIGEDTIRLQNENNEWKLRVARVLRGLEDIRINNEVESISEFKRIINSFYSKEDIEHAMRMVAASDEADYLNNALKAELDEPKKIKFDNSYKDYSKNL